MQKLLDILASGIHETKNQLFIAESLLAAAESKHGIDLDEARYTLETAANRLARTLTAYRLLRHSAQLAIIPTIVGDLCEEIALDQKKHLATVGITLEVDNQAADEWPFDRELVEDMLSNAVQNAGRHARSRIRLSAGEDADGLWLRVEDDGPGFASLPPRHGTGLLVAERLAELHVRGTRHGKLTLDNDSALGGARFELRLP
jgi:signal transduction histidine kinase